MDNVHTFHNRKYDKADDLEDVCWQHQALILLTIVPGMVLKALILIVLEIYYLLLGGFNLFVPKTKTLKDIRGQLAAVSLKLFVSNKNSIKFDVQYIYAFR